MQFGSLSKAGGENRLNVAVSRAREKIYIVSSIEPEQLNVSGVKNRGPRLMRQYLEYAKAVSARSEEAQSSILRSINPQLDVGQKMAGHFESEFEEQVARALEDRGLVVRPQVGVSGYRIDLGVVDPDAPSRYLLGIECDGAAYHSARDARERDAYRQRFLESRGWTIHRIWSRNWWSNPRREVESVLRKVRVLGAAPSSLRAEEATQPATQPAVEEPGKGECPHAEHNN
jgi:very-short-patch-repair endonuclease